jgi:hypothetical protein
MYQDKSQKKLESKILQVTVVGALLEVVVVVIVVEEAKIMAVLLTSFSFWNCFCSLCCRNFEFFSNSHMKT